MRIKPVQIEDAETLARIQVAARNASYSDFLPPQAMTYNDLEEETTHWREWLPQIHAVKGIDEDGHIVGFCGYGPLQTRLPSDRGPIPRFAGEIFGLYIHPDYWRNGYGRALLQAGFDGLKGLNISSACLWVKTKNVKAQALYLSMGGEKCGKRDIDLNGYTVKETAIGFRRL